jgi:hypothetical protein
MCDVWHAVSSAEASRDANNNLMPDYTIEKPRQKE